MAVFNISDGNALFFEHTPPGREDGATFCFFNMLTGDTGNWEAEIGPALRDAGHGTCMWNFRGQKDSPFDGPDVITADAIVDDAVKLIQAEVPRRPVYVGGSIGGLFAAQAHLRGTVCDGLLLINTLRKAGPRLDWSNRAAHRAALVGGGRLIQDLMLPHLTGPAWQAADAERQIEAER
ncbi:MAG: alpha/beta hydrolase, partial [Geminicoccaceae bacterium]